MQGRDENNLIRKVVFILSELKIKYTRKITILWVRERERKLESTNEMFFLTQLLLKLVIRVFILVRLSDSQREIAVLIVISVSALITGNST